MRQEVKDEKERAARMRHGAKAVTYGSYNLKEMTDKLQAIVKGDGHWQPTIIQGFLKRTHNLAFLSIPFREN